MGRNVQAAELRSHLSAVLDEVEGKGRTVGIERRGKLVAQVVPVGGRFSVEPAALRAFCERHAVDRLYLFGSVLRDDFGPGSDVDVLYETKKLMKFSEICRMEDELAEMFGRPVDLVDAAAIRASTNRFLREGVLSDARVFYGQ